MKKLVALAVAGAFVAPVYAAEVSLVGSYEAAYTTESSVSTLAQDSEFNLNASTTTSNGLSVKASIQMHGHTVGLAGDNVLSVGGPFGTVSFGDVASGADRFDDKNDFSKVYGTSLTAPDASISWALPSFVPNLSVYASHSPDSNGTGNGDAPSHTGIAVNYAAGPVVVSLGQNQNDDNTKVTYTGVSASFSGLTVAFETMQDNDATEKLDEKSMGISYKMGDITLFWSNQETQENDVVGNDVTAYGVHYSLGGGVLAFLEFADDDRAQNAEQTAVGLEFKF